jgi:hypothetical protein
MEHLHDMLYTHDHTCQSMSNMKASFGNKKTKHMWKDKRKMHHWCLCHCWLFVEATTWNLTTLGSHSIPAFRATHSKFTQFTFHLYKCFCKFKHAIKSLAKRVSKGQRATTLVSKVLGCSLNIVVVYTSSSKYSSLYFGYKQEWNCKKIFFAENVLLEWQTKKGLA